MWFQVATGFGVFEEQEVDKFYLGLLLGESLWQNALFFCLVFCLLLLRLAALGLFSGRRLVLGRFGRRYGVGIW